ncbi:hypothetical protein FSP39_001840 [Pinctada imbricata]|uniref:Reverse transcriptase domain-containing protein n=1 Tax=Pinctada imbricata TaxID=66713 RepID=A0AA88XT90_PINIB|nr:hypothetical protein FSP39_001840 [Pinctada imbricata]
MSIFTGVFPEKLKTAKVTPIYKKGDKSDPGNYRPISILPTISKLFERHITTQMYDYLKENDLLMKEQSGFRKSHSCQTALTKLTEKWITDIDNGNMTGVSLLDFRKAFDLVNHKILIDKMKYYNFTNETLNWLESYLSNRTQTVHIGNVSSNLSAITCGVPQGSVLGPVLFLLYINDLPLHVKNSILDLFADDATLHKANNNLLEIERDMNEDMDHISAWCKENRMVINESKTKCILVGARQKISRLPTTTLSLKVNDKLIDNLTSDKLLGVYIDNYLQFDKHIDEVCKAITQKIALLRRIKKYLGLQHRVLYYNAYILPSIDYCLTIYGNASKSHLDRILKLQKSAARVIMDAPPDTPSQPLFDELDWLNIYDRCCDVCGGDHPTEACPELGLETTGFEDATATRARLTLPYFAEAVTFTDGEVGVIANANIPRKSQFGPFEAKKTTHEFSDEGLFILKILVRDGTCVSLDTTDENECNWMSLIRAAPTQGNDNLNVTYSSIVNIRLQGSLCQHSCKLTRFPRVSPAFLPLGCLFSDMGSN